MKRFLFIFAVGLLVFSGCSKDDEEKQVSNINFDESTISLKIGDERTLSITHYPQDAIAPSCSFESENANIATVSKAGVVVGVSIGETTITACVESNLMIKTSCKIIVEHIIPTKITLSNNNLNLKVGDAKKLSCTIMPANLTLNKLKWTSTDEDVVAVDSNGNIIAKSVGSAKIKVEVENTNVFDICDVSVSPIPVSEINLEIEGVELIASFIRANVLVSKELAMQAIVYPENATNKQVIFESSDNNIVEIKQSGNFYRMLPKSIGFTEITAKTVDNVTAKCEITVQDIDYFATIGLSTKFVFDAFGQHNYLKVYFDTNVSQYVTITQLKVVDSNGNEPFNFTGFPIEGKNYTVENLPISTSIMNIDGWKAEIHFLWNGKDYVVRSK